VSTDPISNRSSSIVSFFTALGTFSMGVLTEGCRCKLDRRGH
jgi:hypothetical protein